MNKPLELVVQVNLEGNVVEIQEDGSYRRPLGDSFMRLRQQSPLYFRIRIDADTLLRNATSVRESVDYEVRSLLPDLAKLLRSEEVVADISQAVANRFAEAIAAVTR